MNKTVKEIVKCCFTCKHYHLFASRCDDKKGQLFLLDPKELPCPAWEQEKKEHKGLFE